MTALERYNNECRRASDFSRWVENQSMVGVHKWNPYHNVRHHQMVVNASVAAWEYSHGDYEIVPLELLLAAGLHDYDHTGGVQDDEHNILLARKRIGQLATHPVIEAFEINCTIVEQLIAVTEFNGAHRCFAHTDPYTFMVDYGERYMQAAACLRDADLMAIYTEDCVEQLIGLYREICVRQEITVSQFLKGNREFLQNAPMHTKYGRTVKERYLERQLKYVEALFEQELFSK